MSGSFAPPDGRRACPRPSPSLALGPLCRPVSPVASRDLLTALHTNLLPRSRFAKRTANVSLAPSAAAQAAEKAAEVEAMGGSGPDPSSAGFSAVKSLGDAALPTGMVLESSSSGPSISRLEPSRWLSTDEETKETYLDMLV